MITVLVQKLAPTVMESRERLKKEAATPDWWVAGVICKGTDIQGLSWMLQEG